MLALSLFMFGNFTDDIQAARALNDLAVFANFFYGTANFHRSVREYREFLANNANGFIFQFISVIAL